MNEQRSEEIEKIEQSLHYKKYLGSTARIYSDQKSSLWKTPNPVTGTFITSSNDVEY